MILTLAKTKEILGITSTDYDSAITNIIPDVQDFIYRETQNDFSTGLCAPVEKFEADTIHLYLLPTYDNFRVGDDVFVTNSFRNEGFYEITSVSDKVLGASDIVAEDTYLSTGIRNDFRWSRTDIQVPEISLVRWDKTIKRAAALIVKFHVIDHGLSEGAYTTSPNQGPIQSESVGGGEYSYTFKVGNLPEGVSYPYEVYDILKKYKRIRLV